MNARPGFAVVLASLAFLPGAESFVSAAETAPKSHVVSENLAVSEIGPGVWVHTSWHEFASGARFPANGLIVRDGDGLVLVDTAWGRERTAELLDWMDSELGLPVTLAIVTHFHDDSMGGTPVLAERGIRFVSGELTRELGGAAEASPPESVGDLVPGEAVRIASVEIFYPGSGHSRDNLVVYVPGEKVLFGTCAVRHPDFPGQGNTADADLEGWPVAIGRVRERYPEVEIVVPGHGSPGDASLLSHIIGLFDR